jgi:hypothetical protein
MMSIGIKVNMMRVAAVAAAFALAACATAPRQPESPGERAQARWDALLSGDYAGAYAYLTPGTRSSITEIEYTVAFKMRRVHYDSARFMGEECDENTCTVRMDMGYTLAGALRGVPEFKGKAVVKEKWVRVDGKWWFLP